MFFDNKHFYELGSVYVSDKEKLARPVTVICKANVSKVRRINEGIGRYLIRDIGKPVGAFQWEGILKAGNTSVG